MELNEDQKRELLQQCVASGQVSPAQAAAHAAADELPVQMLCAEPVLPACAFARAELVADLTEAAATLRRYETLHRAKGTAESTEKAEVNAALASRFEATIAKSSAALAAGVEPAPFGWKVDGVSRLYTGEHAEIDAKAEAAHYGGTCKAFPLYTAPQPAAQPSRTALIGLLARWEARALDASPTDAMLINKHIRELREAMVATESDADILSAGGKLYMDGLPPAPGYREHDVIHQARQMPRDTTLPTGKRVRKQP